MSQDLITEQSTLHDLAVLRMKYGVRELLINHRDVTVSGIVVHLATHEHYARGIGLTEAEAINDAFNALVRKLAGKLAMAPYIVGRGQE